MARPATSQRKSAGGKAPAQEKKPQEKKQDEKKPDEKTAAKRHVARRPLWVQPKMAVSQPGDAMEQEAEQVARSVAKPEENSKKGDAKKPEEKQPEDKKGAAGGAKKLARKEIDAESKLEKKKEQQKEKAAGEAEQAAKAEESKKKEEPKKAPAEEKAARRPKITRAASGAIAPLMRRERVSEPGRADHEAGADVEQRIESKRGGGAPLPPAARADMEQKLGHDFSQVRVHDDAAAQSMAHELDAHAFTVGNDVFFGSGQLAPGTAAGDHLMAHELTHVVQQGGGGAGGGAGEAGAAGGAQRVIARDETKDEKKKDYFSGKEGVVDKVAKKIEVADTVTIPELKQPFMTGFVGVIGLKGASAEHEEEVAQERLNQRSVWEKATIPVVEQYLAGTLPEPPKGVEEATYFLTPLKTTRYLVGTAKNLAPAVARPTWTKDGDSNSFDVDHKHERQLGGSEGIDNLWLLDSSANRSSGAKIHNKLKAAVDKTLTAAAPTLGWGKKPPSYSEVRKTWNELKLLKVAYGGDVKGSKASYERVAIETGASAKALRPLTPAEKKSAGLTAKKKDQLALFLRPTGGRPLIVDLKDGVSSKTIKLGDYFTIHSIQYEDGIGGVIDATAMKGSETLEEVKVAPKILPHPGVPQSAYIEAGGIPAKALKAKKWSPITLGNSELSDKGIVAAGVIEPSLPALQGQTIDLAIDGDAITISKTFAADDVKLPGPIKLTGGSIAVSAGTKGIAVKGEMDFEVDKLCKGTIRAGAGANAGGVGLSLDGECRIREDLFDPGELKFHYESMDGASKLTGSAELGIKTDKLKFVKSASGKVTLNDAEWGLEGTVVLDIPGADEAKLTIGRAPDGTVTIGGTIAVAGKGPFKGGKLDATLTKGDDGWKAKGTGSAELAVPGLDAAKVAIDYENGAFTAIGDVSYKKGMLDGSVHAGVTNRAVGEDGQPSGEATPNLTVFGQGTVTLQIAPWLKGTVGIQLLPNGEVEIKGEIALPSAIDLFPEKRFDKNLFSIGIDIPIVGFSIMGQRIGIFATIGGGLDFSAGVGPGQLRDTSLKVKYNPAHEDETQVDGSASFVIPADAGLTMKVHGGIGAGIPVVSAVAGLEVSGKVGLEAEAKAAADVHWNPREGLKLHAEASLSAEPVFKFDVSGFVKVDIDLLLWEETLYEKRWSLAAFEYGSGLKMGVTFPVDYDQQKGLDLSLDNIQIEYPKIDAGSLLESLIDKL